MKSWGLSLPLRTRLFRTMNDEEKFELIDKIFDLKLAVKEAEMERDWTRRQELLEELEEIKKQMNN